MWRTRVLAVAPLPRAIALYAADILGTLRSAVEHTLYAEVEHHQGNPLTSAQARAVEMPAATNAKDLDEKVKRWTKQGLAGLRRGSPLLERVHRLQPYQRIKTPEEHPLALLVSHSNLAKHRMPAVAAVKVAAVRPDRVHTHPQLAIPDIPSRPVRVGDVLAETSIDASAAISIFPTVGLNRPGTDRWPILITELEELTWWVRTQALPILIVGTTELDALPTWNDTTVGHDDERAALGEGRTSSTAASRYRQRLATAQLREEFPALLAAHPTKPSRAAVDQWVTGLDDAALLERFNRLSPGFSRTTLLHNAAAFEELLEEIHTNSLQEKTRGGKSPLH